MTTCSIKHKQTDKACLVLPHLTSTGAAVAAVSLTKGIALSFIVPAGGGDSCSSWPICPRFEPPMSVAARNTAAEKERSLQRFCSSTTVCQPCTETNVVELVRDQIEWRGTLK